MEMSGTVKQSAMRLYSQARVTEATNARAFWVNGDGGTRYCVVLDGDNWSCTCPATRPCKHLGAALLESRVPA